MQVRIGKKFIFPENKEEIGELHKHTPKRQMFLLHNHTLHFGVFLNRILLYNVCNMG